ncbi:MAG TPA: NAD(P)-dependent oxidoreductase [bacterium]|nr:NAD(P)-dependent oxidoreductase [bacterium]
MVQRVLLTGADGFVGRHLLPRLAAAGYEVLPCDLRQGCDLTQTGALDGFRDRGITTVIHLAGLVFVPASWGDRDAFTRVNAGGTEQVAAFCVQTGARLLLVSAYVYGIPQYLPIDECHPPCPNNPYAASKLAAEAAARAAGVPLTIVRPFNLYGPGQDERFLIPSLVAQARTGAEIVVNDLAPRRDYLHVDDFCAALLALLHDDDWHTPRVFNAGAGCSHSVGEVLELLNELQGGTLRWRARGVCRENEIPDTVADCRALQAATGWYSRITLHDGLAMLLETAWTGNR